MPMTISARKSPGSRWSESTRCRSRGDSAPHVRPRTSRRRHIRRPAPALAAGASDTISSGAAQPICANVGNRPDREGRKAHDDNRDQERVFAPDKIADPPEDQCAERPDQKTGGVGRKGRQQGGGLVPFGEEQRGKKWRQNGVKVEVVPLENGTERRSENDSLFFLAEVVMRSCRCDVGGHILGSSDENPNRPAECACRRSTFSEALSGLSRRFIP